MIRNDQLRPLERRIRHLVEDEVPRDEIARRFRRSPAFIDRVIELSELSNRAAPLTASARLRPLERRVLRWRDEGASPADIAPRFNRSPEFIEQVEELARYKLDR